jgi:hypothetical protein
MNRLAAIEIDVKDRLAQLIHRFRQQQQFSIDYSPLYAAIFGTIADWLMHMPDGPVAKWLLDATRDRPAFDVTNLLLAGLHREILSGLNEVAALAVYYPTVGGNALPEFLFSANTGDLPKATPSFVSALNEAILARQQAVQTFIQSYTVQTNETGRGISWLLPACLAQWDGVHLIDLGASAGLNLVAEQRVFQFLGADDNARLMTVGYGQPAQFAVRVEGEAGKQMATDCQPPLILSRTGCDLQPFRLETAVDELTLASFIWADQVERLQRLREGIVAFHEVNRSDVPVRLNALNLPDELPAFLEQQIGGPNEPVLLYNTYIKMYLRDNGAMIRKHIANWAVTQNRPVVWIQWEPQQFLTVQSGQEPHFGWLAWTADLWHGAKHEQHHLGWVHPHGHEVHWLPDLQTWISYWRRDAGSSSS